MPIAKAASKPPKIGQRVPEKNINGIWTKKLVQPIQTGIAGQGKTYGCIIKAPCPDFTHVRLVFANQEATPGAITDIAVAVTNSNADKATPSTGSGLTNDGSTGWVRGKFSGSNGVTLPAAGVDANNPAPLASDWIPIDSIAPTDGSSLPYLLARVLYSTVFSALYQGMDASTTDRAKAAYMETYHTSGTADAIGTPTLLTHANKANDPSTPFYAFEFLSSKHCIRTACIGDSITAASQGTGVTAGGWWQLAQDLLIAAGYPVNLFQSAVGGRITSQYCVIGKGNITQHKPAVALYSLWSPNNGPGGASAGGLTQAVINAAYRDAVDFVNYCRANDVLPIFTFLAPNDNYSSADDLLRLSLLTRARNAGMAVIDLSGAVATSASPQRFQAGMGFDTVHPNGTGHAAMAASFVSQYLALLQQSFTLRG